MNLVYVHDPMCSWCWAFRPVWLRLKAKLPAEIAVYRLLGGLAPDTDAPMPESTRAYIIRNWMRIKDVVPDTSFNFDFWTRCRPRRSTYPACRAVIAAVKQGPEFEEPMIEAIQRAYYLQARNPSDTDTLVALAKELRLDLARFTDDLKCVETQTELLRQIELAGQLGAQGFPSLILQDGNRTDLLRLDYQDENKIIAQLADFRISNAS